MSLPYDNCPSISNANQLNTDGDSQGDACDSDDDNDGIADGSDNCPLNVNVDQLNTDGDSQGNVCDVDDDNDGIPDASDNFPLDPTEADDVDSDGIGNNADPDDDNDGLADVEEIALGTNPLVADTDGDAINDQNDAFPNDSCAIADTDHDGKPDVLYCYQKNWSASGYVSAYWTLDAVLVAPQLLTYSAIYDDTGHSHNFSHASNITLPAGTNNLSWSISSTCAGGACLTPVSVNVNVGSTTLIEDNDDDGDSVDDSADNCIIVSNVDQLDTDSDSEGNACDNDDDNDGVEDTADAFPLDASESADTDADGVGNNTDTTPNGDTDNDGVDNLADNCAAVSNANQLDTDSDAAGDVCDTYPQNPLYSADTDRDTLPDNWETANGRDPAKADYAVSVAYSHACTLDEEGVKCWGSNNKGQLNVPATLQNPYAITTGTEWSCACDDNGSQCWGRGYSATPSCSVSTTGATASLLYNGLGFCNANPPPVQAAQAPGFNVQSSCSINSSGEVFCNTSGTYKTYPLTIPQPYQCVWTTTTVTGEDKTFSLGHVRQLSQYDKRLCMLGDKGIECAELSASVGSVPVTAVSVADFAPASLVIDSDGDGVPRPIDSDDLDASVSGDTDGDGVDNAADNCVTVANADQLDTDGDSEGNACDNDDDNDGVADATDAFPLDAAESVDTDGDGVGNNTDTTPNGDTDNDGVDNLADNCVSVSNTNQLDTDTDGMGDACDSTVNGDTDNDGIDNLTDNCPSVSNANQSNADGDAQGDACDTTPNGDTDNDGVDNLADNCVSVSNANQLDTDTDGMGDACDSTVNGDNDNDGIDNLTDNCPSVSNADQSNTDGDAQGDACDTTPNGDTDNDGVDNLADNCVSVSNASQLDTDTDGIGDACDNTVNGDTDNDGIDNLTDNCPSVSNARINQTPMAMHKATPATPRQTETLTTTA
jgi:hypothetical protein